ncbi:DUF4870 domain-containing protein [Actinomadura macrotermitis]|uniref:DUF4870 domain-containing protein n=1 Tax=Actinomadura macrotermitis TaxID=2585200 RepID=A0A7K0BNJ1_9ACTN|nr:DUF4870 domain-containing protein [Actinomadura macrotermitis]MQY02745.1 hypothetical protein [Actinomadura macrotermitis]
MTYGPPTGGPDHGQDHGQQGYGQEGHGQYPGYEQYPGHGRQPGQMQYYGGGPGPTSDERTWGLLCHLGQFLVGLLAPLIVYLTKKDESPFLRHHGAQGLNFAVTQLVYFVVNFILIFLIIGIFTMIALAIAQVVFLILAAVAANRGEWYTFPSFMAWPMFR